MLSDTEFLNISLYNVNRHEISTKLYDLGFGKECMQVFMGTCRLGLIVKTRKLYFLKKMKFHVSD